MVVLLAHNGGAHTGADLGGGWLGGPGTFDGNMLLFEGDKLTCWMGIIIVGAAEACNVKVGVATILC